MGETTGLAQKPMIAVPEDHSKAVGGGFLSPVPKRQHSNCHQKDFERANRRKFLAKIATGNWDAVIIAHSSWFYQA